MRKILALVGAATVAFLALGWYLGWYQVNSTNAHGQQSVNVSIDPDKITTDVKKGVERGSEIVDNLREKSATDAQPVQPAGPASSFFTPTTAPTKPSEAGSSGGWKPTAGEAHPAHTRGPRN